MPILENISQLASCPGEGPQDHIGEIADAAIAWRGNEIAWVGPRRELPSAYTREPRVDCGGRLVIPGLIDCHTHLCFGGWRGDEFERRLRGASYQEIAAAGGGILGTVQATRAAGLPKLVRQARSHLDRALELGITSMECKSGYGLDLQTELKQLQVYQQLGAEHAMTLVPTYLGAHSVPPEFRSDREAYIRLVCEEVIPQVAEQRLARFCDAFVEEGAFSCAEAREILAAAQRHGLGIKVHADQLSDGGGAALAAELGAISAEHLEYVSDAGIAALAAAGVVAVSLPLASLYLREKYLPARKLIQAGVAVAVASDFNPGSAPSYHLPLAMMLACLNQGMSPAESLKGATAIAAKAIGMGDRLGSLRPGFLADIAIIDAPNLNHWLYHFLPNACVGVIKNGSWVHRSGEEFRG